MEIILLASFRSFSPKVAGEAWPAPMEADVPVAPVDRALPAGINFTIL
jgi:hypothetical protein